MFEYRLTPWDSVSFVYKTAEIISIDSSKNSEEILQKYLLLENKLKQQGVDFVYTRINSQDFKMRSVMHHLGFYFAECSQLVYKTKIQGFIKQKLPKLKLEKIKESDVDFIKNMVSESFNYSRFHEDANIPQKLSRKRYYNWIEVLIKENAMIQVAKVGDKIVGVNIQLTDLVTLQSKLILTGCSIGHEFYALSLWNEIISYNKELGIRKLETMISASNIGVANIYSYFGFKVEETQFGYHKKLMWEFK
jgi:hypothetical protein